VNKSKRVNKLRYIIEDTKYRFKTAFDTVTGAYVRTGILDEHGNDTGVDPFMASYPHLIDVGIMGHCIHGKTGLCAKAGIGCYQSGLLVEQPNMAVEDFRWIAEQSKGRCNQFALGGRGDPGQHEYFEEILKICRENILVPNFTTSGYGMTPEIAKLCKQYCGAVAVSWYRSAYTLGAIQMLLDASVKTNIHYVLGKNSIDEAVDRLKHNDFPRGINAVIFLLHKPAGQGTKANVLEVNDPRVAEFFEQVDKRHPFKVGMDSCNVPGAVRFCKRILPESLDTCEGGRYSCYIGADMIMVPCSFDQKKQYEVSLREMTVEEAWNSEPFERFRNKMHRACPGCEKRDLCMGGCPLMPEIVFCDSKFRSIKETVL
jgi:radical SAM protein with 4Fe4S-binding SPASM domain